MAHDQIDATAKNQHDALYDGIGLKKEAPDSDLLAGRIPCSLPLSRPYALMAAPQSGLEPYEFVKSWTPRAPEMV